MATILVTHGIPAEGFSLLSGEKIVIPKPLMQFSMDELAALIPAADAVVACGALPQVVLTPHIGTNTQETRLRMAEECARQIADALAGKRPEHVVNGIE